MVLGTITGAEAATPVARAQEPVGATGGWSIDGRTPSEHPALAPSLADDLAAGEPTLPADEVGEAGAPVEDPVGATTVEVVVEATSAAAARAAVVAVGGAVDVEVGNAVQAQVPAALLGAVADAAGVTTVREPRPAAPAGESEGVASIGADDWHVAGWVGTDVDVAVVDVGFGGYLDRLGGALPSDVDVDLSRCADPDEEQHGTAVAEVVHDVAPAARLRLVCIETDLDFVDALSTLAAAGVDVVNLSLGFTLVGRGDGTPLGSGGPDPAMAVAALRAQGVLVVASSGNHGLTHHHQAAIGDADGPGYGDFVDLTADDRLLIAVPGGGTASVGLQWDSWFGPAGGPQPNGLPDLDLYVGNATCGQVGASTANQGGVPADPWEFVTFRNCSSSPQVFEVLVNRYAGNGTPRLDLWFDGVSSIEAPTGSSITEPASSPAVLAVGAYCVRTGTLQPYSGQGPTVDGRSKPDVVGPDATSSTVYGPAGSCADGFTGTSASSPHAAGLAALLLGANPSLDVAELHDLVVRRAVDAGPAGVDPQYGAGRLAAGRPGAAATPTPQPFTAVTPVRLLDTRPGLVGAVEAPARSTPVGAGVGQILTLPVAGVAGSPVPADATAVVLNVTVTEPTASSYVSVRPVGGQPTTSNLNFAAGRTVAQHVTATVGTDGRVRVYNNSGTAHVVVDLAGWYGPTGVGGPATSRLNTLPAPARAFDSRPGPPGYAEGLGRSSPLAGGVPVELAVANPLATPTAIVLNVTVTEPTTPVVLTVWPAGEAAPVVSSLNVAAGQTRANLVVVRVSSAGRIALRLNTGSAHVVVDTVGWYQPNVGAGYVALDPPTRVLDSRTGTGWRLGGLTPPGALAQGVAGAAGVPADAVAALLSVVAVAPTQPGYLSVYPSGQALPLASSLNFAAGEVVPNAVVARLGLGGQVNLYGNAGRTDVVADVAGYFLDPVNVPLPLGLPPVTLPPVTLPPVTLPPVTLPPITVPPISGGSIEDWIPNPLSVPLLGTTVHLATDNGDGVTAWEQTFTLANAEIHVSTHDDSLSIDIDGDGWFSVAFDQGDGDRIQVGATADVHRFPFHVPGLSVAGNGSGCNTLDGEMVVDRVVYDAAGTLTDLTARLEQRCGGPTRTRVFIRYDADDPTVPLPPPSPLLFLWYPPLGAVPATGNFLYLQSEAGDYIGGGQTRLITDADGALQGTSERNWFQLDTPYFAGLDGFHLDLATRGRDPSLPIGLYADVARWPFHNPRLGGFSITGQHRGCNDNRSDFTIDTVAYAPDGRLQQISGRFVQYCGQTRLGPALRGAFRWVRPT